MERVGIIDSDVASGELKAEATIKRRRYSGARFARQKEIERAGIIYGRIGEQRIEKHRQSSSGWERRLSLSCFQIVLGAGCRRNFTIGGNTTGTDDISG